MPSYQQHPSSFRDPSGFVFESAGKLYRQINQSYASDYELMMKSGLYDSLIEKRWLISHTEVDAVFSESPTRYKTIQPQYIPFLSYPYEWCFEQLKDAALLTLNISKLAIDHGLVLKDATPYNIQFLSSQPFLIDTLSFEKYDEQEPWIAYRQFCECFLNPLLIAKYTPIEVNRSFTAYPDGISAKLAASLLPGKARLGLGNWLHVYLAATVAAPSKQRKINFNKKKLLRIIENLREVIQNLQPFANTSSAWNKYYEEEILSEDYLHAKIKVVTELAGSLKKANILDLGCNDGLFSKLFEKENQVISVDDNVPSISKLYTGANAQKLNILPLCIDLTNPPGAGGVMNQERKAFLERGSFDLCLALAIVHHLSIGKNIPFPMLAGFFSKFCNTLIIEFVPKQDEKVQQLLLPRKDIFGDYNQEQFESAFNLNFNIEDCRPVPASSRLIYKMQKK